MIIRQQNKLVEVLPAGFLSHRFAARRTPLEEEMEGKKKIGGWTVDGLNNGSIEAQKNK